MNNIIFKYFAPISPKQWKQKIQYLLNGKNYQSLIHKDIDGINTLPFYTHQNTTPFESNTPAITSKPAYYYIVTDVKQANLEALTAIKNGAHCIYFAVFDAQINLDTLLKDIAIKSVIQCYFLDINFSKQASLKNKKCDVLHDCLGKISKTGNWFVSGKKDFQTLNSCISSEQSNICINLSNFHNAGATAVQQLGYGISQFMAYAKNTAINKHHKITYLLSVGTDIYKEVAKIKTLRILHKQIATSLQLETKCTIIQQKSKRHLSGLLNEINTINTATERHIAQLGGVDFFTSTPNNYYFYKEDIPNKEDIIADLHTAYVNFTNYADDVIYIKKITAQLEEKSLHLIETLEKGGGFIEQLKKGTIQQKIAENEAKQTKFLTEQINTSLYKNNHSKTKTPISYPFLKFKKRKTLWQPIIEKQWRAGVELPYWKENFES